MGNIENLEPEKNQETTEIQPTPETETPEIKEQTETPETNVIEEIQTTIEDKDSREIEDNKLEELKSKFKDNFIKHRETYYPQTIKINEEYINKQPPEIQKILRPIKGDVLTERALKNYINAQLHIQKLESKFQQPTQAQPKTEPIQELKTPEFKIEDIKNFDDAVYKTLRLKYPDLPENPDNPKEAIKEYLSETQLIDPIKYYQVIKDYDLAQTKIKEKLEEFEYLAKNWQNISADNIKKDIDKFENTLKQYGLSIEDLGLNLEFDDKFYNEYLFNNIIFDKNKNINEDVVKVIDKDAGVFLIPEGAVYRKLVELNFDKILNLRSSTPSLKPKIPPSMSSYTNTPTKQYKVEPPLDNILELNANEIDDEILEKYKEQLKSNIIGIK